MSTSLHIDRIAPGGHRALIGSIEAHVAREHLPHCALCSVAIGDASCPGRFGRGPDVRPGTADTVPVSRKLEPIGLRFPEEAEASL